MARIIAYTTFHETDFTHSLHHSDVPQWIDVGCRFTNTGKTGKKPADLKIWIDPNSTIEKMSVHLKSGSTSDPYKTSRRFHLQLKKYCWCLINALKDKLNAWEYCTYFSISDATIVRYKPFKVWNKIIHSKDADYYCYLKHPNGQISFFYFH